MEAFKKIGTLEGMQPVVSTSVEQRAGVDSFLEFVCLTSRAPHAHRVHAHVRGSERDQTDRSWECAMRV